MRRFLYFVPGAPGVNPGMLRTLGLFDRFARAAAQIRGQGESELIEHVVRGVDVGPACCPRSGCLLAAGSQPPEIHPAMEWVESDNQKFFLAVDGQGRGAVDNPGPADLERELGISGPMLTLADGAAAVDGEGAGWRVPMIRRWDREKLAHVPNLPQSLARVPGQGYSLKVIPAYAAIDALAQKVFEAFVEAKTIKGDDVFSWASAMLAVNYRLGAEEVGMLGLLDEDLVTEVLSAAIDLDNLKAHAIEAGQQGMQAGTPAIEGEEL